MATRKSGGGPQFRSSGESAEFSKLMRDIEEYTARNSSSNTIKGRLDALKKALGQPEIRLELRKVAEEIELQSARIEAHVQALHDGNEELVEVLEREQAEVEKRIDAVEAYLSQEIPRQVESTLNKEGGKALAKAVVEKMKPRPVEAKKQRIEAEKDKKEVISTIADEMATVREHLKKMPDSKELLRLEKWLQSAFKSVKENGLQGFERVQKAVKGYLDDRRMFREHARGERNLRRQLDVQRIVRDTSQSILERVGIRSRAVGSALLQRAHSLVPTSLARSPVGLVRGLSSRVVDSARSLSGRVRTNVSDTLEEMRETGVIQTLMRMTTRSGSKGDEQRERVDSENFKKGFATIVSFFKDAGRRVKESSWLKVGAMIAAGFAVASGAVTEAAGVFTKYVTEKFSVLTNYYNEFVAKHISPLWKRIKDFFEPIFKPIRRFFGIDDPVERDGSDTPDAYLPTQSKSLFERTKDFVGYDPETGKIDPHAIVSNIGKVTGISRGVDWLSNKVGGLRSLPTPGANGSDPIIDGPITAYPRGYETRQRIQGFTTDALDSVKNFFRKKDDSVNIDGLHPDTRNRFYSMLQEYRALGGKRVIQVNSAKRSHQEQSILFAKNPKKAARPGTSDHELGRAIDINSSDASELARMGLLDKYGFTRPVPGEPWHLQQKGVRMITDRGWKADDMGASSPVPPITNIVDNARPSTTAVPQRMIAPKDEFYIEPTGSDESQSGGRLGTGTASISTAPTASSIPMFSFVDPKFMMANTGVLSGR